MCLTSRRIRSVRPQVCWVTRYSCLTNATKSYGIVALGPARSNAILALLKIFWLENAEDEECLALVRSENLRLVITNI